MRLRFLKRLTRVPVIADAMLKRDPITRRASSTREELQGASSSPRTIVNEKPAMATPTNQLEWACASSAILMSCSIGSIQTSRMSLMSSFVKSGMSRPPIQRFRLRSACRMSCARAQRTPSCCCVPIRRRGKVQSHPRGSRRETPGSAPTSDHLLTSDRTPFRSASQSQPPSSLRPLSFRFWAEPHASPHSAGRQITSAVTRPCRYEPEVNRTYADRAR